MEEDDRKERGKKGRSEREWRGGVEGRKGKEMEGKGMEGKGMKGKGMEGKGMEGKGMEGKGMEGRKLGS